MAFGNLQFGGSAFGADAAPLGPTPGVVGGTGTVQTPVGVAVAKPSVVAGTGVVQAAALVPIETPGVVGGVGTINSSVGVAVAKPSVVSGTGTVQTVLILGASALVQPAVISGSGAINAPIIVTVAKPTFISGVGTVQSSTLLAGSINVALTIVVLLSGLPTSVTLGDSSVADLSAIGASTTTVDSSADWAVITV